MTDRTVIVTDTVDAQRRDLLRQVVFNRAGGVPGDQKLLFSAEIGLTLHAFMAEFYAAALQDIDPERAEQVAQTLAGYLDGGALPEYAWDRAEAWGHNPQEWADEWDQIMVKRREQLRAPFVELEQQLKDTQMMRDFYQRSAEHLRAQIDAAIAVHERGEHDGLAICLHCSSLSFPPPESGIWSDAAYPCQTLRALGVTDAPTTASEESAR